MDLELEEAPKEQVWAFPKELSRETMEPVQSLNKNISLGPLKRNLKFKPKPNEQDFDALHSFCSSPVPNVIARTCFEPEKHKNTPLHLAAFLGLDELLGKPLQWAPYLGKDYVNARNRYGATPLHLGTQRLSTASLTLLLNGGADVNTVDCKDRSVLDYTVHALAVKKLQLLLERGAYPMHLMTNYCRRLGPRKWNRLLRLVPPRPPNMSDLSKSPNVQEDIAACDHVPSNSNSTLAVSSGVSASLF